MHRGGVHAHTERRHGQTVFADGGIVLRMDGSGVAQATELQKSAATLDAGGQIRDGIKGENGREFFRGERNIAADWLSSRAISTRVVGGTLIPAISATKVAGRPTIFVLGA